ncbi:coiled-coil domain-containing protein 84 [Lingula anatina]|uniref:Coiled-coil domain-containing protein 84 n=1 Tax=Lingula anatina TaxID=7574 RepID=A0A1S3HYM6_LINAN|nr:coiled-coil domain-containing protein 84 [Lingula anatina]|eukprot:XP_013390184.1 coiled-coil domain-containing protein 84 [Lingula anatina]
MSTSFIQFTYCSICRQNHQQGKKHVFSKGHRGIVKNIVDKFYKKVQAAKNAMKTPLAHELSWEMGAKFWCYFCAEDVEKHTRTEEGTVEYGGFIQHFLSASHIKNMHHFFYENKVEKSRKENFILSMEDFARFQVKAEQAVKDYVEEQRREREKEMLKLRQRENERTYIIQQELRHKETKKYSDSVEGALFKTPQPRYEDPTGLLPKDVRTESAFGEGLETVKLKQYDPDVGNIFKGSTPPWLRPVSGERQDKDIGPTVEDLQKHLEAEQKKKLPAKRVGANFKQESLSQGGATWLPSFGGVWHHQRRANQKYQFLRKSKQGFSRPYPSVELSVPVKSIKPYQRKRPNVTDVGMPSPSYSGYIPTNIDTGPEDIRFHQRPVPEVTHSFGMGGLQSRGSGEFTASNEIGVTTHFLGGSSNFDLTVDNNNKHKLIQTESISAALSSNSGQRLKAHQSEIFSTKNGGSVFSINSNMVKPYHRKRPAGIVGSASFSGRDSVKCYEKKRSTEAEGSTLPSKTDKVQIYPKKRPEETVTGASSSSSNLIEHF